MQNVDARLPLFPYLRQYCHDFREVINDSRCNNLIKHPLVCNLEINAQHTMQCDKNYCVYIGNNELASGKNKGRSYLLAQTIKQAIMSCRRVS